MRMLYGRLRRSQEDNESHTRSQSSLEAHVRDAWAKRSHGGFTNSRSSAATPSSSRWTSRASTCRCPTSRCRRRRVNTPRGFASKLILRPVTSGGDEVTPLRIAVERDFEAKSAGAVPSKYGKPLSEIIESVEGQNASVVIEVEFDDGGWKVEIHEDGKKVKWDIDPKLGKSRTKLYNKPESE